MKVLGAAADLIAEVSGYIGELTVEKLGPDTWSSDYFTILGGLSAGAQVGGKIKIPKWAKAARGQASTANDFQSPFPWTSGNFGGGYTMLQGSVRAGLGAGVSYSKGVIIFSGDGSYPELLAPADSWSFEIMVGGGAGAGGSGGWMWGGKEEAVREAKAQQALDARSAPHTVVESHFAVDDPSLTSTGRQAIRVMSALHRAEFENPTSVISVDGYASPTGSHARNQLLSELRAKNVLQAIRDSLNKAFRIPSGNVHVEGHGETPALQAGVPRGTETAAWRRVDITVNGQVVLTLD
jgi:outer membrane protein OmpA-like peptidoglycan-associated protein